VASQLWDAGRMKGLRSLHDALGAHVFRCLMRWDHWVEMVVPEAHLLQDIYPQLFVDYRKDCTAGVPRRGPHAATQARVAQFPLRAKLCYVAAGVPEGAAVVCFPRSPKPHEVDAEWVRECWR
jgi:hypothetical protein